MNGNYDMYDTVCKAYENLIDGSEFNVLCVCVTLIILFTLWTLRGQISSIRLSRVDGFQMTTGDNGLILELHAKLTPIEQDCMRHVIEHTDVFDLLPIPTHEDHVLEALFLNQLVSETLKMSAFSNDLAKSLHLDHVTWCEKRLVSDRV
jgi:hypothetical protein